MALPDLPELEGGLPELPELDKKVDPGMFGMMDINAVPNPEGLQAPELDTEKVPSFMKNLEMLNDGVHRGVTRFTLGLMSTLPFGERYQNALKKVDERAERKQQKNIKEYPGSWSPQIGEFGGEMAMFAPAGGAMGAGANLLSGAGKIARYAGNTLIGGSALTANEGFRYDPDNPGLNTEAMKAAATSPITWGAGALTAAVRPYASKAQELEEVNKILPGTSARDLREKGTLRTFLNNVFEAPRALTDMGKRASQMQHIGDDIRKYIAELTNQPEILFAKDYAVKAGQRIQQSVNRLKNTQTKLYKKAGLEKEVADSQSIKDLTINALDEISNFKSAIPAAEKSATKLTNALRKTKFTVDDVKNIRSEIGTVESAIRKGGASGLSRDTLDAFDSIRLSLKDKIQKTLSKGEYENYITANTFSKNLSELMNNVPQLKKAVNDEIAAKNLVWNMIGEAKGSPRKEVLSMLSGQGKKQVEAAKLMDALEKAEKTGVVDLRTFINATADTQVSSEVFSNSTLKAIQGLNKYLDAIDEGAKTGWWKQGALTAAVGGTSFATGIGAPIVSAAAASYPALLMIANHSPLKRILGALNNNLPKSTYEELIKAAERNLGKAGFIYSNGVLKKKDEE